MVVTNKKEIANEHQEEHPASFLSNFGLNQAVKAALDHE
jgi:hypothetical protein